MKKTAVLVKISKLHISVHTLIHKMLTLDWVNKKYQCIRRTYQFDLVQCFLNNIFILFVESMKLVFGIFQISQRLDFCYFARSSSPYIFEDVV
jgi:hypothetical protein